MSRFSRAKQFILSLLVALSIVSFSNGLRYVRAEDSPPQCDESNIAALASRTIDIQGKSERLKRIDELLAGCAGVGGPDAELALLRLMNAKAELIRGRARLTLLDGIIERHANKDPGTLSDEIRVERAKAILKRIGGWRDNSPKVPLLEKVIREESGSKSVNNRYQAFRARLELAALESDNETQMQSYQSILDDIEKDPDARAHRFIAGSALLRLARREAPENRIARYDEVVTRFENDRDADLQALAFRAKWLKARLVHAPARMGILTKLVEEYKDRAEIGRRSLSRRY